MVGALIGAPAFAWAQGEHARRAGSEIAVMIGDLRRVEVAEREGPRREGLAERIAGGLAGLALLMRLADQELGREPGDHRGRLAAIRDAFAANNLATLGELLAAIARDYPLKTEGLLLMRRTPARTARGREMHERLCAGCHDQPDAATRRPAYNLFSEAQELSPAEFAARLIVGVRGDVTTGIDTPFSDEELAQLIAYYTFGPGQ